MSKAICNTNKELPEDITLGDLLFYSIDVEQITEDELKNLFTANNLDIKYIKAISPFDVFRRATSSVKGKKYCIINSQGEILTVKVEIDEVKNDNSSIKRIIGFKYVNLLKEDVDYIPVAYAELERNTKHLDVQEIPSVFSGDNSVFSVMYDIKKVYNDWLIYHNSDTIKNIFVKMITDMHPVSLTSTGGCKFIPKIHKDTLYNLKNVINSLSSSNGALNYMELIPVIDTEEQRNLIKKASTDEFKEDMLELITEIRNALNNNTVSTRGINSYKNRLQDFNTRISEYEGVLDTYLDAIKAQIAFANTLVQESEEKNNGKEDLS